MSSTLKLKVNPANSTITVTTPPRDDPDKDDSDYSESIAEFSEEDSTYQPPSDEHERAYELAENGREVAGDFERRLSRYADLIPYLAGTLERLELQKSVVDLEKAMLDFQLSQTKSHMETVERRLELGTAILKMGETAPQRVPRLIRMWHASASTTLDEGKAFDEVLNNVTKEGELLRRDTA